MKSHGQVAYETHVEGIGAIYTLGWRDLPEDVKAHWEKVAKAVIDHGLTA